MANFTWTSTSTTAGNYSTASNWTPSSGFSLNNATEDLFIGDGVITTSYTISMQTNTGNTTPLDLLTIQDTNALFKLDSTAAKTMTFTHDAGTSGVVVTAGTLSFAGAGAGAQKIVTNAVSVSNTGSITSNATGTLTVAKTLALSAGTISFASGLLAIGATTGTATVSGIGSLNVSGGQLSLGTFNMSAGTLTQSGGLFTNSGAATFSGGTETFSGTALFQAGTVNLNTALTLNAGTIQALTGGGGISVASGTVITMGGGTLDGTQGGVANAGTITGTGAVLGAITGAGTLLATGGTLEIGSAQSNASPVWQIASASALRFDANASADTVTFNSTADGDLALNGGAITFTDTISGMNVGASATAPTNFIDLLGTAGVTISSGGTVTGGATTDTIVLSTGQTLTLSGVVTNGNSTWYAITKSDGSGGTELFLNSVICYAEGTAILTDRGEVAVESLQAGDRVITLQDGQPVPMAITWTGNRHIDLLGHPRPYTAAPVRIRAGAFGDDLPRRDLLVSPAHGIYVDGKLVPANLLINHMTIVQDMDAASVSYHHIELERHALILAEGLTSESYLDTGNRAYFDNAGLAYVAHPEFHVNAGLKTWEDDACAPLAIDAETVAPIWHSLAARAETLGYSRPALATTADADIFLEANGRRLRPVASADGRYSFMLPAGTKALTLRSRATAPAALNPLSGDWRPLGVAVRGMTLRAGDDHIVIPADHPGLTNGWHTVERNAEDLWRWTAGAATLPLPAIATPMMLDIEIANTATYILAETVAEQRLAA